MSVTLVQDILASELVLMSPLARNMATAFIVLATACQRLGADPSILNNKDYVVTSGLREKVASDSDQPGTNPEDSRVYIRRLAKKYGRFLFKSASALDSLADKVASSYESEQLRSENWGRGWNNSKQDYPVDSEKFLKQIDGFRSWLSGQPAQRVFAVGHNGWSRWAFAAGLVPPCPDRDAEAPLSRLVFGGHDVRPLPNLGLMRVAFDQGVFSSFDRLPTDQSAPAQTCTKKTKFGLFSSSSEAKAAKLLPSDAIIQRMMLKHEGQNDQTVTFSASGNRSFLASSTGFAKPVLGVELNGHLAYACDHSRWKVHLAHAKGNNSDTLLPVSGFTSAMEPSLFKPFRLEARSSMESVRLCNLLNIFARFAKYTNFISKILSEDGWDQQIIYTAQDADELHGSHRSEWDSEYEKMHAPFDGPSPSHRHQGESSPSNLPTPLWLLRKATRDDGVFADVDKYEDGGMTCTKVKWLGITWLEYC